MLGDDRPNRAGDVYFALYTLAMQTGQTRSPSRIAALLKAAGFEDIAIPRTHRPFVTSVVTTRKPS
jgi:demethylspheroidene O-methyltransferase